MDKYKRQTDKYVETWTRRQADKQHESIQN